MEAITYAMFALVGLFALATLLLWRALHLWRRSAEALEALASEKPVS
jgi:type VI protein secretion system component VasF